MTIVDTMDDSPTDWLLPTTLRHQWTLLMTAARQTGYVLTVRWADGPIVWQSCDGVCRV